MDNVYLKHGLLKVIYNVSQSFDQTNHIHLEKCSIFFLKKKENLYSFKQHDP